MSYLKSYIILFTAWPEDSKVSEPSSSLILMISISLTHQKKRTRVSTASREAVWCVGSMISGLYQGVVGDGVVVMMWSGSKL